MTTVARMRFLRGVARPLLPRARRVLDPDEVVRRLKARNPEFSIVCPTTGEPCPTPSECFSSRQVCQGRP